MATRTFVIGAASVGLGLAVGLVYLGMKMSGKPDAVWLEIAKGGAQLGIVSIIGGAVAAALKALETAREERRRLNEYRLDVFRDVTASYNTIKAVRRTLRAYGFGPSSAGARTAEQVAEFHIQMKFLNEAQLALERLKRELRTKRDAFQDTEALSNRLNTVEKYVSNVLKDWEEGGQEVVVGVAPSTLATMTRLRDFLDTSAAGFEIGAATPMDFLEERVGLELRSSDEAAPRQA